jgi:hypothetical protein
MITIYHAVVDRDDIDASFKIAMKPTAALLRQLVTEGRLRYVQVAKVDTDDLETAFERTNTIMDHWWINDGVEPLFEGQGCRSTSVGDIMVMGERASIVASFGFEELADDFFKPSTPGALPATLETNKNENQPPDGGAA